MYTLISQPVFEIQNIIVHKVILMFYYFEFYMKNKQYFFSFKPPKLLFFNVYSSLKFKIIINYISVYYYIIQYYGLILN